MIILRWKWDVTLWEAFIIYESKDHPFILFTIDNAFTRDSPNRIVNCILERY